MISIFKNLLRFDLWPKMWSILENIPCALEKKVYSSAFGWNILKISMKSISSNVSLKMCFIISFLFWWSVHWCRLGVDFIDLFPSLLFLDNISPFVVKVVWWYWILLTFACLKSFLFLQQFWKRSLMDTVILVVDFSLSVL